MLKNKKGIIYNALNIKYTLFEKFQKALKSSITNINPK